VNVSVIKIPCRETDVSHAIVSTIQYSKMWVILLSIVVGLVIAVYAGWKYLNGNKGYWPSRNVFLLDVDKVVPLWDRLTFKVTFQEIERKAYKAFKEAGVKTYGGVMEFRSPSLVVLDLELMKHVL